MVEKDTFPETLLRQRGEELTLLDVGTRIEGRYLIERKLGEGGMGEVWAAVDENVGDRVAIKLLLPGMADGDEIVHRFDAEARILAQLRSPNVVHIRDRGRLGSRMYIVMDLLEGQTLAEALRERGSMSVEETFGILREVTLALEETHEKGLVHRDLKPANIFLERLSNTRTQVRLLDFGIAKAFDEGARGKEGFPRTATGALIGTPLYMAPEQLDGISSPSTDLYALGVVAYECLSGVTPFCGSASMVLLQQQMKRPPPFPSSLSIPSVVEGLVVELLEKDPAKRPPSAEALRRRIDETLGKTREMALFGSRSRPGRSRWWLERLGALVASATVALVGGWALSRGKGAEDVRTEPLTVVDSGLHSAEEPGLEPSKVPSSPIDSSSPVAKVSSRALHASGEDRCSEVLLALDEQDRLCLRGPCEDDPRLTGLREGCRGDLRLEVTPAGARVSLEPAGAGAAASPRSIDNRRTISLPAGLYRLRFEAEGCEPTEQTVRIPRGSAAPVPVKVTLTCPRSRKKPSPRPRFLAEVRGFPEEREDAARSEVLRAARSCVSSFRPAGDEALRLFVYDRGARISSDERSPFVSCVSQALTRSPALTRVTMNPALVVLRPAATSETAPLPR